MLPYTPLVQNSALLEWDLSGYTPVRDKMTATVDVTVVRESSVYLLDDPCVFGASRKGVAYKERPGKCPAFPGPG